LLSDAKVGAWRDRAEIAKHWFEEYKAMEECLGHLGRGDYDLYKSMREWHNSVAGILKYKNDVLSPRGFQEIVKDDYAGLLEMLARKALSS
jgi:hypothetical protein